MRRIYSYGRDFLSNSYRILIMRRRVEGGEIICGGEGGEIMGDNMKTLGGGCGIEELHFY
jgi:hypothetical protein